MTRATVTTRVARVYYSTRKFSVCASPSLSFTTIMANPEEAIVVTSGDSDESTHVEEATPQTPAAEPEVPIEVQPGSGEPEEQAQEKPQPQFVEPR